MWRGGEWAACKHASMHVKLMSCMKTRNYICLVVFPHRAWVFSFAGGLRAHISSQHADILECKPGQDLHTKHVTAVTVCNRCPRTLPRPHLVHSLPVLEDPRYAGHALQQNVSAATPSGDGALVAACLGWAPLPGSSSRAPAVIKIDCALLISGLSQESLHAPGPSYFPAMQWL